MFNIKKLEDKNIFAINKALEETVVAYNNIIHKCYKSFTLEIFYCTYNKFLLKNKA